MTTVMILPENPGSPETRFRAVAGAAQSEGETAGAALDALAEQIGSAADEGMLVVVRPLRPDTFFTAAERAELDMLMAAWRAARDQNRALEPKEQSRLEQLVTAEMEGAARRSAALARDVRP